MQRHLFRFLLLCLLLAPVPARGQAVDVAPRITDREIIERLTTVEGAIKRVDQRIDGVNQRLDGTNQRIDDTNRRIGDTNQRISDLQHAVDRRLDDTNQRIDDTNQRITDLAETMRTMFTALIALMVALFGYIAWDRRTMFRPLKERLEQVEVKLDRMCEEVGSREERPRRSGRPVARSSKPGDAEERPLDAGPEAGGAVRA